MVLYTGREMMHVNLTQSELYPVPFSQSPIDSNTDQMKRFKFNCYRSQLVGAFKQLYEMIKIYDYTINTTKWDDHNMNQSSSIAIGVQMLNNIEKTPQ
jgi:hypothetical protein